MVQQYSNAVNLDWPLRKLAICIKMVIPFLGASTFVQVLFTFGSPATELIVLLDGAVDARASATAKPLI